MTNVPLRRPILASQFFRPFLLCLVVALLAGLTPLGEMLAHAQSSTTVGGLQVNQGPVLPAMCNPNNSEISSKVFYLTSGANPGLYSCTAVNTWTAGGPGVGGGTRIRSEEHTSELQSRGHLVCRLLLEKKKKNIL